MSLDSVPLILLALAAYRTTRLVLTDTITKSFRDWWYIRFPPPHLVVEAPQADGWEALKPHYLGKLMSCYHCLGFWVSLTWAAAYWAWPVPVTYVALPLALSVVVGKLGERD